MGAEQTTENSIIACFVAQVDGRDLFREGCSLNQGGILDIRSQKDKGKTLTVTGVFCRMRRGKERDGKSNYGCYLFRSGSKRQHRQDM